MPITSSAKKAIRVSARKKLVNDRRTRAMKDEVKKVEKAVKAGKKEDAAKMISVAFAAVDKAAKRGVIKKNTASRKKARLARLIKYTLRNRPSGRFLLYSSHVTFAQFLRARMPALPHYGAAHRQARKGARRHSGAP